jgi:Flp pilus assembly protein CpaB
MNLLKDYKAWLVLTIVLALAAGILSVWLINSYIGAETVLVNNIDLDRGAVVQPQALAQAQCPRGNLYPDAVVNVGQIAGKAAKGFIPAGTILRLSMFTDPQLTAPASRLTVLGKDYEAVAVASGMNTNVAGTLNVDDRVDVYVYPKDAPGPEKIISGALVLQAGTSKGPNGALQQSQGIVLALDVQDLDALLPYLEGTRAAPVLFTLRPAGPQT